VGKRKYMLERLNRLIEKFDPVVHLSFVVAIIILFFIATSFRQQVVSLKGDISELGDGSGQELLVVEPSSLDETNVRDIVSGIVATLSATPRTIIQERVVTEKQGGTGSVSLDGTASTTSTSWEDVAGSEVYIDLVNDYDKDAYVTFEANLKVEHANGQAFVRLYDDTNKIAVIGSELSTTNNADFKQVTSGSLALWRGRNLYKVQLKSLNSTKVTFSGGRVKISY